MLLKVSLAFIQIPVVGGNVQHKICQMEKLWIISGLVGGELVILKIKVIRKCLTEKMVFQQSQTVGERILDSGSKCIDS